MLKWTCRLRDALVNRRLLPRDAQERASLSKMREAEFVRGDGAFPNGFRWEEFEGCFSNKQSSFGLLAPAINPERRAANILYSRAIRRLAGKPVTDMQAKNIDVLWLSSTIFVSSLSFDIGGDEYGYQFRVASSYTVKFYDIDCEGRDVDYEVKAYSLAEFEGDDNVAPSPLPLEFLCHLAALLPLENFWKIELSQYGRDDISVDCLLQFIAIIPPDVPDASDSEFRLQLTILCAISKEGLRQILSHQFHPAIQLAIDTFNESVLLSEFLGLFREPRQLRAIEVPFTLVEPPLDRNSSCPIFIDGALFKSSNITMSIPSRFPFRVMSHEAPSQVAEAVDANNVNVVLSLFRVWSSECETYFRSCVLPFLNGSSCLERLTITVHSHWLPAAGTEWVLNSVNSCQSRELCFFDVLFTASPGMNIFVQQWDKVLFPRVGLNYFRKHLSQPLRSGVIPLAIKAVNDGNICRMITGCTPFDMDTSNAGLIFQLLKAEATTLQTWLPAGDRKPPRSGQKRPAP
jgi:hypothetical protein